MTHQIAPRTRSLLTATAGTAVVAVADLLDRNGASTWVLATAVVLLVAAGIVFRAREVALRVDEDALVVRNLFTQHVVPFEDVEGVTTNPWHTVVELHDGRRITSLLRAEDLVGLEDELPARGILT